jgi:hypothetical protein
LNNTLANEQLGCKKEISKDNAPLNFIVENLCFYSNKMHVGGHIL